MKTIPLSASCVSAIILAVSQPVSASVWEARNIDGVDYISIEQIQKFYGFKNTGMEGASVRLESNKIDLKLETGTTVCLMNGTKFILAHPVRELQSQVFISQSDLTGLLEPVFRPNFIKHQEDFRTVILDSLSDGTIAAAPGITEDIRKKFEQEGYKVVVADNATEPTSDQTLQSGVAEAAIVIRIAAGGSLNDKGPVFTSFSTGESAPASVCLATAIHGSIIRTMGKNVIDEGIRRGEPSEFHDVKHPAILISVPPDEASRHALARAIVSGVNKYRYATGSARYTEMRDGQDTLK